MSRWIIRTERALTEDVPAAPPVVRAFYVDLENMKLVHPLVESVRRISRRETADGLVEDYRISDRIPLWRLSLPVNYGVRMRVPVEGAVITTARQFPRVQLDGAVSFEAIDSGTRIIERLRISAPLPLTGLTTRQAAEAHRTMLAAIRRRFEEGP
jgi:hypothetical protein